MGKNLKSPWTASVSISISFIDLEWKQEKLNERNRWKFEKRERLKDVSVKKLNERRERKKKKGKRSKKKNERKRRFPICLCTTAVISPVARKRKVVDKPNERKSERS